MKVTITALKAPWPEGSKVGSVVELEGDTVPAWAVGKCTRVPDGLVAGGGGPDMQALQAENAALRAMLEANKPAVPDESAATSRRSR
jgi:hypothetical protein